MSAQGEDVFGLRPVEETTVLGGGDIRTIAVRIINVFLGLLGIIAVVLILYAGYTIMTAGGDEDKVADGKRIIRNAVIGLAIILSAYAIVQFVASRLESATGVRGGPRGGRDRATPGTFSASGALGEIIGDHYPFRDETGVRRNTRIAVTFRESIDPASFIVDTTGNGIVGDCRDTGGQPINWATDCDQLNTAVVRIFPTDTPSAVVAAAVLTVGGENNDFFTFVFRPLALLGSDTAPMSYTVELLEAIRKADGETSAFVDDRDGRYTWEFETTTVEDSEPPTITSVYPASGSSAPRNSIVQIQFSEAMDPSVVQGRLGGGSSFSQLIFGERTVSGNWRVTNGYRTAEFISSEPCGQNSCGEEMYCLPASPASCSPDNPLCRAVLARTARLLSATGFESVPLTGVADIAGNALDGDADGAPDGKPPVSDPRAIGQAENRADNYLWSFTITNTIDRRAPFITRVSPGIDEEDVGEDVPVRITFSNRMAQASLSDIAIVEHALELPFWHRVRSTITPEGQTIAEIDHRAFGPDGRDVYYFPTIPSTVMSITQNCLYPGRGPASNAPNTSPTCVYEEDAEGNPVAGTGVNCVPVNRLSTTDSGCVYSGAPSPAAWLQPNVSACVDALRDISPLREE